MFRDMSFTAQQHELDNLTDWENWELVNVLERAGWQFKRSIVGVGFKGWWVHPDHSPHLRGDPKELYADTRNVFLLYTNMDLAEVLANMRARVYGVECDRRLSQVGAA